MLLHGLVVSSRYVAPAAAELARAGLRAHAPDLPGFGGTPAPRRGQVLGIAELADALLDWIAAARLVRPTLVATSLGCQIALAAVARAGTRHGGAAPRAGDRGARRAVAGSPCAIERLVLQGPMPVPQPRLTGAVTLAARWLANVAIEPPALALPIARDLLDCGPVRGLATLWDALDPGAAVDLAAVDLPALVVRGERDRICDPDTARRLAERLPRGQMVAAPGAAHAMPFSAPRALARIVTSFADG